MPDNNLHSINKLQDDIKAAKWLSVFLPKEKRQQIKELETSLANMIHLIESFNKYFSDAGWCAYDSMNMPLMENAVKAYLHTQISRAICLAAYEKPLTVEEISISTGIPTMYVEDELPRLEYGDAICKVGNKYVTNFIIFRLKDRKQTEDVSALVVSMLADKFEVILREAENKISALDFYGNDFGIGRLGYIVVPYLLRHKISDVKNNRLKLENGPYPPRKDGGYGWFIVEETVDESENCAEYNSGCNVAGDDSSSEYKVPSHIYYYWISKYFNYNIVKQHGGVLPWAAMPLTAGNDRKKAAALISQNRHQ